jgi:signal transduction histidine kinase
MWSQLSDWLFDSSGLTAHGFCLLWEPGLIWTYAVSDTAIAVAYFSIPAALAVIARRRKDLVFRPLLWLFAAFILLCGTTHWLDLATLWLPWYGIEAVVKAATAVVSIFVAISLWWFLPHFLAFPSHEQLREANAALLASQEQLAQAQKMEAVGQLTGGIAHDFNNMLQVITGALAMMERRIEQGRIEELPRFVSAIRQASDRAARLTNRLLAFSRRQALQPRSIEPGKLIQGLEELLRRTLGPEIRLILQLGRGDRTAICDPNQLESTLLNLAINARDAMPDEIPLFSKMDLTKTFHPPANCNSTRLPAGSVRKICFTVEFGKYVMRNSTPRVPKCASTSAEFSAVNAK